MVCQAQPSILRSFVSALRRGVGVFLPPRCLGCGLVIDQDNALCPTCWAELTFIGAPQCRCCGDPFELAADDGALCASCMQRAPQFTAARAALVYDRLPRLVLMRFKYGGRPHAARMMAKHIRLVADDWLNAADAILVPVPLARWRLWRRGYNQAGLIAAELAKHSACTLHYDLLIRHRSTAPSAKLNVKQRRLNVKGAFSVPEHQQTSVLNKHVLLVDDVLTSGSTADACAQALIEAGALSVRLVTWARTLSS